MPITYERGDYKLAVDETKSRDTIVATNGVTHQRMNLSVQAPLGNSVQAEIVPLPVGDKPLIETQPQLADVIVYPDEIYSRVDNRISILKLPLSDPSKKLATPLPQGNTNKHMRKTGRIEMSQTRAHFVEGSNKQAALTRRVNHIIPGIPIEAPDQTSTIEETITLNHTDAFADASYDLYTNGGYGGLPPRVAVQMDHLALKPDVMFRLGTNSGIDSATILPNKLNYTAASGADYIVDANDGLIISLPTPENEIGLLDEPAEETTVTTTPGGGVHIRSPRTFDIRIAEGISESTTQADLTEQDLAAGVFARLNKREQLQLKDDQIAHLHTNEFGDETLVCVTANPPTLMRQTKRPTPAPTGIRRFFKATNQPNHQTYDTLTLTAPSYEESSDIGL